MSPPFNAVFTKNPAVAGTGFEAVNWVPFNAGEPPFTVMFAVPFAQLQVYVVVTSGKYWMAIGAPKS
jgi:hypothetical protein